METGRFKSDAGYNRPRCWANDKGARFTTSRPLDVLHDQAKIGQEIILTEAAAVACYPDLLVASLSEGTSPTESTRRNFRCGCFSLAPLGLL